MTIERLCSDKIERNKIYDKHPKMTHSQIEGDELVQYRCNPSPKRNMAAFPWGVTEDKFSILEVKGFIYSYIIPLSNGWTKHYSTV